AGLVDLERRVEREREVARRVVARSVGADARELRLLEGFEERLCHVGIDGVLPEEVPKFRLVRRRRGDRGGEEGSQSGERENSDEAHRTAPSAGEHPSRLWFRREGVQSA